MHDRYETDVLASGWRTRSQREAARVAASPGVVVETDDGFCGAVIAAAAGSVELEDRHGRRRVFSLGPGFLIDGAPAVLVSPAVRATTAPRRTASGSIAAADDRARTARASRILVEGRHDAELVEKVWGDDLRAEGVVVEYLEGVDLLEARLRDDPPSPQHRYGVLVDHLVAGSKESRIADAVSRGRQGQHVRIVGHPFVDVWQCVTPRALGISAWPDVPRGIDFKVGVCRAFGWPADTPTDRARAWQRILGAVTSYRDLEPALLGRVEELIDFVTAETAQP